MTASDLEAVSRIASVVHLDYPEDDSVFAERLALFPAGCQIAIADGRVVGYGLFHPGILGAPPKLNSLLGGLPSCPDCLYLHDVALLTAARGLGLGRALLEIAADVARRLDLGVFALTATPQAKTYWRACAFKETAADGDVLAGYGVGMRYMTRPI